MKPIPIVASLALLLGVAASLALPARAESPAEIPNPQAARRSFVADNANVLSDATERKLDDLINGVKSRTGAEIVVVTVSNLGGLSVEDFANELFNRWKIGGKAKDDGVLVLAAISDRKIWIEVGYGAEAELTDGQAGQIYRSIITPRFRAGDFNGGLYNGTLAVAQKLDPSLANSAPTASDSPRGSSDSPFGVPDDSSSQTPLERPQPSYDDYPSGGGGSSGAPLLMLLMLGGAGALSWVWFSSRPPKCPKCKTAMDLVPENEEDAFLSDIQQLEESLGGREWNVWRCPKDAYQEIMRHDKWLSAVSDCPRCGNRTATSTTQTLRYATQFHTGLEQTTHICHNPACRYHWTTQRVIARDVPVVIVTGGGGSSRSGGGGFGGGSSGSRSGGGSFGGGSSGGGGAGGSW